MPLPIILRLAVGESGGEPGREPAVVSLADAVAIVRAAREADLTAVRLADRPGLVDPSVVAGYLAGREPDLGYLVEVPTTHHAPYNVARRVLSLDRATGGRVGLVLVAGEGDEVSEAVAPDPSATDAGERWAEYAGILARLWESFPAEALIGDQEAAVVVDTDQLRPLHHQGRFYRVAGPLDGPSSPQGRPVLAADLGGDLDWSDVAESVDVVTVWADEVAAAVRGRATVTGAVDRAPEDVVLVARVAVEAGVDVESTLAWADAAGIDALELVPTGGAAGTLDLIARLGTHRAQREDHTLRAALGLRAVAEVLA